jgi:hypothetical protein
MATAFLLLTASLAHAQSVESPAAVGGGELPHLVSGYLVGFVVGAAWFAFRSWRSLRADVNLLRGRR